MTSIEHFITFYQQCFNLQGAAFSRIDHEDAMVAIVYRVELPTGRKLILKISTRPNDYLREVYFLKHFAGILPVPRMIDHMQPEKDIYGAILMECLPGSLLTTNELTDTMAYEIGSLLASIHLHRMPSYGDPVQQNSLNPDPRIYFTLKFKEGLDECQNHLPAELIEKCNGYFERHVDLIASIDGPCVVHRDFRPGNLLVYQGKLEGIIDWAGARASFAEEDFCAMEHGEWPDRPNSKKAFLDGYASIRTVPSYQEIMPLLRLSKAIATVGFTVKQRTWDNVNARIYQFNRRFLETFVK